MKTSPPPDERSAVPPEPRRVLRFELAPKTMVIALLMIAALWMLGKLLPVVFMIVAALALVGTFNPLVVWLEARQIRRKGAIAIVFGSAVVFTAPPTQPSAWPRATSRDAKYSGLRAIESASDSVTPLAARRRP